jgi:hypothetical protein
VPATAITDYHQQIRDAMKATLEDAVPGLAQGWHAVDEPGDAARLTAPCGVVVCVGPEGERPELSTNLQDGIGYSVAVMLLGTGKTHGEQQTGPTNITEFRRVVRTTFNNKRLSGVTQVAWCEVSDSGPLVDEKEPLFQKLATALVVTAIGRFPRS